LRWEGLQPEAHTRSIRKAMQRIKSHRTLRITGAALMTSDMQTKAHRRVQ
jgi:hypothetical protein